MHFIVAFKFFISMYKTKSKFSVVSFHNLFIKDLFLKRYFCKYVFIKIKYNTIKF